MWVLEFTQQCNWGVCLECDTTLVGNGNLRYWVNISSSSSRVLMFLHRHIQPLDKRELYPLKCWDPITCWCSIISQKNTYKHVLFVVGVLLLFCLEIEWSFINSYHQSELLQKDGESLVKESSTKYLFVLVHVEWNPCYKCGANGWHTQQQDTSEDKEG